MKGKIIPYIESMGDMGALHYKPLIPTGKWKYESGPNFKDLIFIEHRGLIFKWWICENNIVFAPERSTEIFECRVLALLTPFMSVTGYFIFT